MAPEIGICPQISDAELVTLAVMQALLGFVSEARWLRHARKSLRGLFPYLPGQSGYNKLLRKLATTMMWLIAVLRGIPHCGLTTCGWWTPLRWNAAGPRKPHAARTWPDGPSTGTAPAIRATSGVALHLLCTLHGLPARFALTGAKADERQVLLDILADPALTAGRAGQVIIGDKNYYGHDFEAALASGGMCLLRPARKGQPSLPGTRFFRPLRQIIESVNDTFKGQLDLERHAAHTALRHDPRPAARPGLTAAICTTTTSASPSSARWSPTPLTPWN